MRGIALRAMHPLCEQAEDKADSLPCDRLPFCRARWTIRLDTFLLFPVHSPIRRLYPQKEKGRDRYFRGRPAALLPPAYGIPMVEPGLKIILTGYRATGKSTVGRLLATRLGLDFIDMDAAIAAQEGRSIRQIVAEQGWNHFRTLERDLLADLVNRDKVVIATGGGAILHQDTWSRLRETGLVVWLTADIDTICRRLLDDGNSDSQRPSLTDSDICAEVAFMLAEREPLYEKGSHFAVSTMEKSTEQIVDGIEKALADSTFLRAAKGAPLSVT